MSLNEIMVEGTLSDGGMLAFALISATTAMP